MHDELKACHQLYLIQLTAIMISSYCTLKKSTAQRESLTLSDIPQPAVVSDHRTPDCVQCERIRDQSLQLWACT